MSDYSYSAPPPPPPAAGSSGATPWYKQPGPLFLLGVLIAAAVAIPVLIIVLRGDDTGGTAASSTTTAGVTTTTGATTTEATSTTAPTTTQATTTSTTSPTTTSTQEATTTTSSGTDLSYNLPALFGEDALAGGFGPDPWPVPMQAGGPIDVDDLDEIGCYGWATAAPSFELSWTAGTGTLLRFYFVADTPGDDTILIISDPYGDWVCNDDYDFGAGVYDPAVDFADPVGGIYDVWVAAYEEGQMIAGTLYVTELPSNHP